ncbi:MAG: 3-oxoadipate enol-lactonase [Syntrophobacter sp.]
MQVRVNGRLLNCEIDGPDDAPVVTLCHSLAANLDMWDPQVAVLRNSRRVVRFDCRGHGLSEVPPGPYTIGMMTEDVAGLLDVLGIRTTTFVGLSMGGMIGQVLAVEYPRYVEKLVLCDTSCRTDPEMAPIWEERIGTVESGGMAALVEGTLERWLTEDFRREKPDMTDQVRNMILRTPVAGYCECARAIGSFDVSAELGKISAPTLIMVGEHDPATPPAMAELIREKIPGSRLLIVPGALHLINIEAADFFNRGLLGFL